MSTVRGAGEDGAGTLMAAALLGVLVSLVVVGAAVVGLVAGHRTAQAAADLAALAAATTLQQGGDPCARASGIATRNGATLRACRVDDWQVAVAVETRLRLAGGSWALRARARAGPVGDLALGQGVPGAPEDPGPSGVRGAVEVLEVPVLVEVPEPLEVLVPPGRPRSSSRL